MKTAASGQFAIDPLDEWKSMAADALKVREETRKATPKELRKNGATVPSNEDLATEAGRLAKSLQRLHPAASESISATVSRTDVTQASFDRALAALAREPITAA